MRYTRRPKPRMSAAMIEWSNLGILNWRNSASSVWAKDADIDEDAVLHGSVQIGTAMFHIRALRVTFDERGVQTVVDPMFSEDLESMNCLCGECPLETTTLPDHEGDYVIVIYPFAG